MESHLSKLNIKVYPSPTLYAPGGVIGKVCGLLRVKVIPYPYLGSALFTAVNVVPSAIDPALNAAKLVGLGSVSYKFAVVSKIVAPTLGIHPSDRMLPGPRMTTVFGSGN